ncbi:MAG: hypothetical protein IJ192_11910 [Clostridia bacterium]|nr:hypothetical protein [Clostridia bacterium]
MNDDLIKCINKVRLFLNQTEDSILFGHIKNGIDNFDESCFGKSYSEFLRICDGLWLGEVDLYGVKALLSNQYLTSEIEISKSDWLCIGNINSDYGYLMMERSTENIYLFYEGYFYKGAGYDHAYCLLGDLNYFLTNYVFGELYASISSSIDDDKWYDFLKKNLND